MQQPIKWGILGCGGIAHKVASDMKLVPKTTLKAVASKDKLRAKKFGSKYHVTNCYGSYEALAKDPEIDIVYVATRHPQHAEATLLCLQHGKAVMCEKPFAMNVNQVVQMINTARSRKLFLMEALWTRFIPAVEKMLEIIDEGRIGDIKMIHSDFGYLAKSSNERLFDKKLGGGSLLDIGIYPLFISLLTLGVPEEIKSSAVFTDQGVDESCAMTLKYRDGAIASLSSTFATNTLTEALIHGTKASIKLHRQFHFPSKLSIIEGGEVKEEMELPITGTGYAHEIQHVNECLENGLTESPLMPLDFSLDLIKLLDEVRHQIGLEY